MEAVTLKKVSHDVQEIKQVLHKVVHLLQEDFELNENVKRELEKARKEPLSGYINHEEVLKEFA